MIKFLHKLNVFINPFLTPEEKYPYGSDYKLTYRKKKGLERNFGKIKTLILGTSHGQYAYFPQNGEYNLCLASQDLYYAWKLYEKYAFKMPELKKVVLFYSVFSPGFELEKTSESFRCLSYKNVFDIPSRSSELNDKIEKEIAHYHRALQKIEKQTMAGRKYLGENQDFKGKNVGRLKDADVAVRTQKALKHNKRSEIEHEFLKKIALEVHNNQQQLIIVLSPAHNQYKAALQNEEPFKALYNLVALQNKSEGTNTVIIDGYHDFDVSDNCFWDYDHLNRVGSQQFTEWLRMKEIFND